MYCFLLFIQEKKDLIKELETLKNQYVDRENEAIRWQELLDHVQFDKTRWSRRVSKLVLKGKRNHIFHFYNKSFLLFSYRKKSFTKITKCRRTTKGPTPTEKFSLPARLYIHLKNLEEERDRYRRELNKYKR